MDVTFSEYMNSLKTLPVDSVDNSEILELRESTIEVLSFIQDLEVELISATGGRTEDGGYANQEPFKAVQTVIFDRKMGISLKDKLDNYSTLLQSHGLTNINIAMSPPNHQVLKYDPNVGTSTFSELHFSNADLFESISALKIYTNKILLHESLAINMILLKKNQLARISERVTLVPS
ncbi:MAG: hypothetical protein RIC80_11455 [Cyclobacteriaceae bacterium]